MEILFKWGATVNHQDAQERTVLHNVILNKQINVPLLFLIYKFFCFNPISPVDTNFIIAWLRY